MSLYGNQRSPSGPTVMFPAVADHTSFCRGMVNVLIWPWGVICPTATQLSKPFGPCVFSVNQTSPCGPAVMSPMPIPTGTGYSVIVPVDVILPITDDPSKFCETNRTAPPGPEMRSPALGTGYSVIVPVVVILPITDDPSKFCETNQTAPPAPEVK